jgi:hypothetical protein
MKTIKQNENSDFTQNMLVALLIDGDVELIEILLIKP